VIGISREFGVAAQERVDQDDGSVNLDAESGMAEPNEFHARLQRERRVGQGLIPHIEKSHP
jgi:hypothetical protein